MKTEVELAARAPRSTPPCRPPHCGTPRPATAPAPLRASCPPAAACTPRLRTCSARRASARLSKIVTAQPCRRSSAAHDNDAGPPPIHATRRPCRDAPPGRQPARLRHRTNPSRSAAAGRSRSAVLLYRSITHAPSHSTSTGQTREQLSPRIFASRIAIADPRMFPLAIFLMNRGTSMCVGQAAAHGASKQNRQRFASTSAPCESNAGCSSGNFSRFRGTRRSSDAPRRHRAARHQARVEQVG